MAIWWASGSMADAEQAAGRQGGRGTARRRTNVGNTRGSLRRRVQQGEQAPVKRWALAKVQHAETAQRAVCSGTARVHDKADERVHGTWVGTLIGVEKRTAAAAAGRLFVGCYNDRAVTNLVQWTYEYLHCYPARREESL